MAARAFGEDGVLAEQFHAGLMGSGGLAVAADAHVAGGDAAHGALVVVEDLGAGEAGVDFDAEGFGLLAEPARDEAEADDEIALVVEIVRHQPVGEASVTVRREHQKIVAGDGLAERGALFLPVGNKLVQRTRIHHRAGEDVRADFGPLFDQADVDFGVDLLEADRGGKSGGATADDNDIELHGLALHADLDR
jgi:hypothetical protein